MNREQMVEKAAKAGWDADTDGYGLSGAYEWRPPGGDVLNDSYRTQARAMLDAVLPQVTTEAEVKALHPRAVLLAPRSGVTLRAQEVLDSAWPSGPALTVVWQPEVTA